MIYMIIFFNLKVDFKKYLPDVKLLSECDSWYNSSDVILASVLKCNIEHHKIQCT